MKYLKKISYKKIEDLKETIRVKEFFTLPVFREGLDEVEIDKIDMKDFLFVGTDNWDWYFSNKIENNNLEKLENVYFSKKPMKKSLYIKLDYINETTNPIYIYTRKP